MEAQDQNTLAVPGVMPLQQSQTVTQPQPKPTMKRGQWLRNRLNSLYSDPIYSKGSPDVQEYYRNKAYDKWVVPYFKHINEKPPTKDYFVLQNRSSHNSQINPFEDAYNNLDEALWELIPKKFSTAKTSGEEATKLGITTLKTTSHVLSGISNILKFAASIDPFLLKEERKDVVKIFSTSENYYDKQAEDLDKLIQDKSGRDYATKVTELGTSTIFFEASGGSAAANALRITNPSFVKAVTPTIKTLWNGAVTGTLWGATTGSKISELPDDAATFALADLGLSKASSVFFKLFNKFVDRGLVTQTVQEAAADLVGGKGVAKPKVEDIVKGGGEVNKQASKAAAAKMLNEMAQKLEGGETNGAFKKLNPKQQKALLMRLTMVGKQSSEFTLDKIFDDALLRDGEEQMQKVVPAAAKIQQEIDQVIQSHGVNPTEAKLATKLPRHETHIDSPLQHISARISFLRNQVKNAEKNDLIMGEVDTLREALSQEQALLKEARAKRNVMKKGQTARAVGNADDASHRKAYEQARQEFQQQNPGEDYTKFSNLSKIMKRADELQRGDK